MAAVRAVQRRTQLERVEGVLAQHEAWRRAGVELEGEAERSKFEWLSRNIVPDIWEHRPKRSKGHRGSQKLVGLSTYVHGQGWVSMLG